MKSAFSMGLLAATAVSFAQGSSVLGTKPDAVKAAATQSPPSFMPLLQIMIVTAVLLFGLKAVAPKLISKLNKRLVSKVDGGIRITESATFAGGSLYVVDVRKKTLLLSVGANGVQMLTDLTEPTTEPEPKLFMEIVDQAVVQRGDSEDVPEPSDELEPSPSEISQMLIEQMGTQPIQTEPESALDRLRRFNF